MKRSRIRKLRRRAVRKSRRVALKAWRASLGEAYDEQRAAGLERSGEGWEGQIGGFCPVQGTGTVDGHGWYFRARGEDWSFTVWPPGVFDGGDLPNAPAVFDVGGEAEGAELFAGSWMPGAETWRHIEESIAEFRASHAGVA